MPRAMTADLVLAACIFAGIAALALSGTARAETWHGLTVAPEHHCSPYDRNRDCRYPQSFEHKIVRRLGAVYDLYTGSGRAGDTRSCASDSFGAGSRGIPCRGLWPVHKSARYGTTYPRTLY